MENNKICLFDNLIKLCNKNGISITELERRAGFKARTLASWKTSVPAVDKAHKISNFFGITVDELITGRSISYPKNLPTEEQTVLDLSKEIHIDTVIKLLRNFSKLNKKQQDVILISIEAFLDKHT